MAELAQVEGQPFGVIDPARIEATLDVVNGCVQTEDAGRGERRLRIGIDLEVIAKRPLVVAHEENSI